jgi:hypothetical protein
MTDVNHQVSKALMIRYGALTLFVVEDLTGIRGATEHVRPRDRYTSVTWAFVPLRQMLEYQSVPVSRPHGRGRSALYIAYVSEMWTQRAVIGIRVDTASRVKHAITSRMMTGSAPGTCTARELSTGWQVRLRQPRRRAGAVNPPTMRPHSRNKTASAIVCTSGESQAPPLGAVVDFC